MMFHRETTSDEDEGELYDEHLQISNDFKDSYVDQARYEEIPHSKKKGFFEKIKNSYRNDYESYHNDDLFVIAEESY